jgi:hypothetical protein
MAPFTRGAAAIIGVELPAKPEFDDPDRAGREKKRQAQRDAETEREHLARGVYWLPEALMDTPLARCRPGWVTCDRGPCARITLRMVNEGLTAEERQLLPACCTCGDTPMNIFRGGYLSNVYLTYTSEGTALWRLGNKYVLKDRAWSSTSEGEPLAIRHLKMMIPGFCCPDLLAFWTQDAVPFYRVKRLMMLQHQVVGALDLGYMRHRQPNPITPEQEAQVLADASAEIARLRTLQNAHICRPDVHPNMKALGEIILAEPDQGLKVSRICSDDREFCDAILEGNDCLRNGLTAALRRDFRDRMPKGRPYTFSHCDLHEGNIMVDATTMRFRGIVDWELAGFYPAWWEYAIPAKVDQEPGAPPEPDRHVLRATMPATRDHVEGQRWFEALKDAWVILKEQPVITDEMKMEARQCLEAYLAIPRA